MADWHAEEGARVLEDPGGNLVEVYARLADAEYAEMPEDKEPWFLV